mmetsp:Transcript_37904/g.98403  ORF Transcript_37904/g.98403 Transcript_37904/m.98403 type:complete len:203 (+) Transcript_37904:83-691(+)
MAGLPLLWCRRLLILRVVHHCGWRGWGWGRCRLLLLSRHRWRRRWGCPTGGRSGGLGDVVLLRLENALKILAGALLLHLLCLADDVHLLLVRVGGAGCSRCKGVLLAWEAHGAAWGLGCRHGVVGALISARSRAGSVGRRSALLVIDEAGLSVFIVEVCHLAASTALHQNQHEEHSHADSSDPDQRANGDAHNLSGAVLARL